MKKNKLSIFLSVMLLFTLLLSSSVYAADQTIGDNVSIAGVDYDLARSNEVISYVETSPAKVSNDLDTVTNISQIDMQKMEQVANVECEEKENNQAEYTFTSKEPIKKTMFKSGNIEEEYEVISLAVTRATDFGGAELTSDTGDITLYGRIGFVKYSKPGSYIYEACKMTEVQAKAYNLRESSPRNLQAYTYCTGERLDSSGNSYAIGNQWGGYYFHK